MSPAGASYFLVDPLDGTREFIAGQRRVRDRHCVDVRRRAGRRRHRGAGKRHDLARRRRPWRCAAGIFRRRNDFAAGAQSTRQPARTETVAVVGRSHLDPRTKAYLDTSVAAADRASGSALKFCLVADGSADIYPRLAPTHDWDIAAGHAIIVAAGGQMLAPDGTALRYGTPELLIPGFVASGDAHDGSTLRIE